MTHQPKHKHWQAIKAYFDKNIAITEHGFTEEAFYEDDMNMSVVYERLRDIWTEVVTLQFSTVRKEYYLINVFYYVFSEEVNNILKEAGVETMTNSRFVDKVTPERATILKYPDFDFKKNNELRSKFITNPSAIYSKGKFLGDWCADVVEYTNSYLEEMVYPTFARTVSYRQVAEELIDNVPVGERYHCIGSKYSEPKQLAVLGLAGEKHFRRNKDEIFAYIRKMAEEYEYESVRKSFKEIEPVCHRVCQMMEDRFKRET